MKRTLSHLAAVTVAALISALPATAHDSKGLVLGPDEGERLIRRWGYPFLMKVDEINGGAKQFVVGSEKLPPGKSIQVHRHDYAEEILVIMAGKGTAVLGDKKVSIDPGTLVFIPQHTWAGLDNTGTETIRRVHHRDGGTRWLRFCTSLERAGLCGYVGQGPTDRDEGDQLVYFT
jgi:quercetin dioxygenase-like cupin family protein